MAAGRRAKDEIAALVLRLKNGLVRGSRQGTYEGMTINDFDQAFERADSALQCYGTIANTSSSSLRQFRNSQRSPIYQLPLEVLTAILILASGVLGGPRDPFDPSSLGKPLVMVKTVLVLAHVSRGLYKMVEALPILWTHIMADLPVPLKEEEFLEDLSKHTHRWEMAGLALTMKDLKRIT
ncbi:hypothetical protein M407DRAFT_24637 [Tulasnella calospora MUT 4182]|uniref:Uncharacterized protein n=1 Tax=Tulasnella calospora MUT 4182 TaxID=1051891 RepID=A0A0C3KXD6_9AGAM|nr:hypothetical protein M407DRAFT_24637 [Tulasnella calospora MUT 4182]